MNKIINFFVFFCFICEMALLVFFLITIFFILFQNESVLFFLLRCLFLEFIKRTFSGFFLICIFSVSMPTLGLYMAFFVTKSAKVFFSLVIIISILSCFYFKASVKISVIELSNLWLYSSISLLLIKSVLNITSCLK